MIKNKKLFWAIIFVLTILIIDQATKIWVKTHMTIGESSYLHWNWNIKWAQILFVENRGMAFGFQFPGDFGKIFLTLLRIAILSVIGFYIYKVSKKEVPISFIIVLSMIFSGAAGNIIDSMFYGLIFEQSPQYYSGATIPTEPANLVSFGKGYAGFLQGNVVDMLHLPMFNIKIPDFIPIWGGRYFKFLEPVFNVADMMITFGIIILLFFSRKWFSKLSENSEPDIEVKNNN